MINVAVGVVTYPRLVGDIFGAPLAVAGPAAFLLAANSWMQHPVGYAINSKTGIPQLNDIWPVLTNPVFLCGYAHVLLASLVTGAAVMLAGRDHPREAMPAERACAQIAGPELRELRWQQTRSTH